MRGAVWVAVAALAVAGCVIAADAGQQNELQGDASQSVGQDSRIRLNEDDAEARQLVQIMQLPKSATVADIGAGSGMFTAALASHLPPDARLIATDLKSQFPPLLEGLRRYGAEGRVSVVEAAVTSTNLPESSCDALIVRRTYHHLFEPSPMVRSFYRTLRSGGRLFVTESPLMRLNPVPEDTPAFREGDGIDLPVLVKELSAAGFIHEQTIDPFKGRLYLVIMRKP